MDKTGNEPIKGGEDSFDPICPHMAIHDPQRSVSNWQHLARLLAGLQQGRPHKQISDNADLSGGKRVCSEIIGATCRIWGAAAGFDALL